MQVSKFIFFYNFMRFLQQRICSTLFHQIKLLDVETEYAWYLHWNFVVLNVWRRWSWRQRAKNPESFLFVTGHSSLLTTCSALYLKFQFTTSIVCFTLAEDNDLTKEPSQKCEPNKLVKVKVSEAIIFLTR